MTEFTSKPLQFMNKLPKAMISHFQSSGSLYLHSLLDGHTQIMTIPGVLELDPIIQGLKFIKTETNKYYETNPINTPVAFDTATQALNVFNIANPKFYDTSKLLSIAIL